MTVSMVIWAAALLKLSFMEMSSGFVRVVANCGGCCAGIHGLCACCGKLCSVLCWGSQTLCVLWQTVEGVVLEFTDFVRIVANCGVRSPTVACAWYYLSGNTFLLLI